MAAFAPAKALRAAVHASPSTKAWLPSLGWGSSGKKEEATPSELVAEAATPSAEPAPLASAAPPLESTPLAESAAVSAATDSASTVTDSTVVAAVNNVYDGISTGTLDLSSLAGSFGPHPIMRLQSLFLHLHESFPLIGHPGLQWAVVIPIVTLFLRFALLPFLANAARMAIIQPDLLKGMEKLKAAKARGDLTGMQAAQMETQALMQKHNVNPIKNLVFPIAQAAVFMCMFFALKGLAGAGLPSMTTEGFGWVQDLTKPDPYYILPLTSTALTLATLETGVDSSTQVQTSTTKNMKTFFRVALLLSLPVISYFPAALLLYWTSNNFISLCQAWILKRPFIRSLLNIPTPPPKPQPGDANYIPEPSFVEAFKNMQVGAQEKWAEQRDASEKARALEDKFKNTNRQAEVYTPKKDLARKIEGAERIATEIWETGKSEAAAGPIRAQPVQASEAEKNRRVAEARRRRLAGKK
ncbi:SPOSA6832_03561, partial [Sporobolomyces salmonicolor]